MTARKKRVENAAVSSRGPVGPRDKTCKVCQWTGDEMFFKGLTCKECRTVRSSKAYLTPGSDELGGKKPRKGSHEVHSTGTEDGG